MAFNTPRFQGPGVESALDKMQRAPLQLTEPDFATLERLSPSLERDAREAVREAQLELVGASTESDLPPLDPELEHLCDSQAQRPVTFAYLKEVLRIIFHIGDFTREMNSRNAQRNTRLDALEKRIDAIEAGGSMAYKGVWRAGERYTKGSFATDRGSVWHANRDNISSRPGDPGGVWTLAVKRGSAGRDAS